MASLELIRLPALMALTSGRRDVVVGLLDGPVATSHPDLCVEGMREIPEGIPGGCVETSSSACQHGTFLAGILSARRNSSAPAICPGCRLLVRPIFSETTAEGELLPTTTSQRLAVAIAECVDAGAWVLNLSAARVEPSTKDERELHDALDYAAKHGTILVAAAGNEGTLASSAITRHPGVIPVVGYGLDARPMAQSNMGGSLGKRGLGAPGEDVSSLGPEGNLLTLSGTSLAAAFVTGAIALLWSEFPSATAVQIKSAVTYCHGWRRTTVAPPLLDAWEAYQVLLGSQVRRVTV